MAIQCICRAKSLPCAVLHFNDLRSLDETSYKHSLGSALHSKYCILPQSRFLGLIRQTPADINIRYYGSFTTRFTQVITAL
jgi:hypothetical protein